MSIQKKREEIKPFIKDDLNSSSDDDTEEEGFQKSSEWHFSHSVSAVLFQQIFKLAIYKIKTHKGYFKITITKNLGRYLFYYTCFPFCICFMGFVSHAIVTNIWRSGCHGSEISLTWLGVLLRVLMGWVVWNGTLLGHFISIYENYI